MVIVNKNAIYPTTLNIFLGKDGIIRKWGRAKVNEYQLRMYTKSNPIF